MRSSPAPPALSAHVAWTSSTDRSSTASQWPRTVSFCQCLRPSMQSACR
jgi:hypothetical protein